jgi:putative ribosome biogenesis GTPase RsgA
MVFSFLYSTLPTTREGLEKAVTEMTKIPNKKYWIVYGNKGVGKSSVVSKCAARRKVM